MAIETVAGLAAEALRSLTASQVQFLQNLPKAELHAHLNGCIPLNTLQELARNYLATEQSSTGPDPNGIRASLEKLQRGVVLEELNDFFGLFPAIYALTATPASLSIAARAVLRQFLDPVSGANVPAQAAYLELRSTPKETAYMTRLQYLETVLDEVEKYPRERAALIVSLDRRMNDDVAGECIRLAIELKEKGRRVVGVDLCGDPTVRTSLGTTGRFRLTLTCNSVQAGNPNAFRRHFHTAKNAGLGVTLHIAEATIFSSGDCTDVSINTSIDRQKRIPLRIPSNCLTALRTG